MRPVNISYYFLFQFQENWYLVQGIQRRSYRVCSLLLLKKWSEGRKCDSNIIYLQKGVCCFSVGWMGWNQIFPGATANKCCPSFGRCRNSCKGQGFRGLASGTGSVQMSLVGWGGGASAEWLLPGGARRPYVPRASANAPSPAATELSVLGVAGKVFYPRWRMNLCSCEKTNFLLLRLKSK